MYLIKLVDFFIRCVSNEETITIKEFHDRQKASDCEIYDPNNNLKFIEESITNNVATVGVNGIVSINACRKTVPFQKYKIKLDCGKSISCADEHIFVVNNAEKYAKDLRVGSILEVENNKFSTVEHIEILDTFENMYDLDVESNDHTYYTNNILSHNSTTIASGFMLHQIVFGEYEKWGILANKGATAREILSRLKMAFEYLPLWIKPGVEEWNKGKITLDNGCSVMAESTSSDAIRGSSLTGLLLDEFAHVENANDFFTSVMPVISSGINTKIVIVSTPNGQGNLYHKIWTDSLTASNGFVPYTADWRVVPERTEEWKRDEIARLGVIRFKQEYECSFSASENTLIDLQVLETIPALKPKAELSQSNLSIYFDVEEGHSYMVCIDPARGVGLDYSTFHIIDITAIPFKQVAVYRSNKINPLFLPNIIVDTAKKYNNAYILMELNKGADIAKDIYYDIEYENMLFVGKDKQTGKQKLGAWKDAKLGLLQTNASKLKGCSNLKSLVESQKLQVVDGESLTEMFTFVKTNTSYAADENKHDDLVMALVLFAWATTEEYFKELTSQDFVKDLKLNHMHEDILPFGFITDYIGDDDDDGVYENTFFINSDNDNTYF